MLVNALAALIWVVAVAIGLVVVVSLVVFVAIVVTEARGSRKRGDK